MQRRLALAAAFVHDPALVFLDEPTAGIDPILRAKFWERFRELRDQGGRSSSRRSTSARRRTATRRRAVRRRAAHARHPGPTCAGRPTAATSSTSSCARRVDADELAGVARSTASSPAVGGVAAAVARRRRRRRAAAGPLETRCAPGVPVVEIPATTSTTTRRSCGSSSDTAPSLGRRCRAASTGGARVARGADATGSRPANCGPPWAHVIQSFGLRAQGAGRDRPPAPARWPCSWSGRSSLLVLFGAGYGSTSNCELRTLFVGPAGSFYEDAVAEYQDVLERLRRLRGLHQRRGRGPPAPRGRRRSTSS